MAAAVAHFILSFWCTFSGSNLFTADHGRPPPRAYLVMCVSCAGVWMKHLGQEACVLLFTAKRYIMPVVKPVSYWVLSGVVHKMTYIKSGTCDCFGWWESGII